MPDERYLLSDARAQEIAERAASKAVHETFRLLGFDMTEMTDVNNLRDDFRFIRQQRSTAETRRSEVFKSTTTAMIAPSSSPVRALKHPP